MHRTRAWLSATLLAVMAVVALSGTAWAHHRSDHSGGNPKAEQVTENDDSDGVANAPDPSGDSDNRHPSGKDKHEESGGSGNQGNSSSEPDGNGSGPERDQGGLDKPDGPGGLDVLDQDGNNGCGNDDDFEDDNEGLCLGRQKHEQGTGVKPEEGQEDAVDGEVVEGGTVETESEVAGTAVEGTIVAETTSLEVTPAEVLGEVFTAGGSPADGGEVMAATAGGPAAVAPVATGIPLAFTGLDAMSLIAVAAGLAGLGLLLVTLGRRAHRT